MKKLVLGAGSLLLALALAACGGGGAVSEPPPGISEPAISVIAPEPEPDPLPYINPLTGEGCETDIGQMRPIAIMINNLKKALPQQGVSQADLIYEVPAEGGITRMLAVFQSVEGVGEIGSVRSAREYYVALAAGLDSIYLHAGGSDGAYIAIKNWGVTALDCVNGPYEGTLFWRDPERRRTAGLEHSVLTSGDKICELLPTYTKLRLEHKEGYTAPFQFTGDSPTVGGGPAKQVSIVFSTYKTGQFEYDEESGLYFASQYGAPYVDGNTDQQIAVRNVLVLRAKMRVVDNEGRLSVDLVGSGSGQLICDGRVVDITWHKAGNTEPMTFQTADGKPLELGVGRTYINIVGLDASVEIGG